jgi:predicted alpha/beta-fold hydrolase
VSNPCLHVEFTAHGGHVGFVEGRNPFKPAYYMERRTGDFLAEQLRYSSSDTGSRRHS